MTIHQLSVFVENKMGGLAEITGVLQNGGVDIRALSIADTTQYGILRLIVNEPDQAQRLLKEAGYSVSLTPVVAIGVSDCPGGLHKALVVLSEGEVSVEYMYAFVSRENETAYVILRVDDVEKAIGLLRKHSIPILTEQKIMQQNW